MIGRLLMDYHYRAIHLPRTRRVAGALAALVPNGGVRSILDVGAGDGRIAADIARQLDASDVVGLDIAERPDAAIQIGLYDGRRLPYSDGRYDAVILSDVLHHSAEPEELLRECLRVASVCVLVKDHLAFGPVSEKLLWLMDVVGNHATGVDVRGTYFSLERWFELAASAGGRIAAMRWPLQIHDLPWRLLTRSELQFAARIEVAR